MASDQITYERRHEMSTAANHRKRSHRSQRAHYRERETQIMSAAKYMGMRKNSLFGFMNPIRKIISRPPEKDAVQKGGDEE